jgi:single-strand DNA-binding protein
MSMLKMQVIGNLGKDCVVNTVNGRNVINFTVAHTEKFKDSQGTNQEKTTWVDCAYWTDKTAVAPYLTKGQQVYTEGTPEVKTFTRSDGTQGASLTLRVREVQLLGGRKNENTVGGQYESNTNTARLNESAPVGTDEVSDDLPF